MAAKATQEALGLPSEEVAARVVEDPALVRVLVDWANPPATEAAVRSVAEKLPSPALRRAYCEALLAQAPSDRADAREAASHVLAGLLRDAGDAQALAGLLQNARDTTFGAIAKARTAKLVRVVLDALAQIPGTADLQSSLTHDFISWAKVFLNFFSIFFKFY